MMKKRRVFIGFVLAWLIWFLNSAITGRTGAIIDIYERGTLAWQSTIELVQAVGKCLYFWVNFTAPFIIDVGNLVSRLNATLTWRMRIMMTAFLSIVIGLYLIARQVVLHQEGVKRVAFQSSILIVAPSLWMGLAIIPNAELWLPTTLMLATSVYPCIQSARSFWTRDVEACGRWLRYWVVFPIVDACREALQEYQTGLFQQQQQQQQHAYDGGDGDVSDSAPPSDGTAIRDAQRILLIFTLWLQVWDGSLSFHRICTHVGSWLWRSLPVRIVPRSFTTKWHKIRHINVLKRVMMLVTDNLLASSMLLAVLGVFVVFFFKLLSRVVPLMIMWGASVNAAEVVLRNIHQLYEQNLAFWILMQGSSLTVLKVPVLGTLMSWFRIPMLVCFYMFGQQLLNVLGDAIGVCANSPSIRGTGGGVAVPSSPGGSSSSSAFTGGGGSGASHNMGSSSSGDSSRSIVINTGSSGTAASGASAASAGAAVAAGGGGSGGGSASLEGGGGGGGGGGGNPPASPLFSPATTKSAASPLSSSSSSSFLSFFGSLPSAATSSALLLFSSSVSSRRKKKQLQQQQHNRNNHHNTSPSAPSSSVVMHVKDRSPSVIRERVTPSSSSSSSHQATTDGMGVGLSIVFGEGDKEA